MKVAVTGGNGDMGRNLILYLLEQGHSVVSMDRALPAAGGLYNPNLSHLVADTRNFGEFVGSIRDCEALIHLAAIRSPVNNPDTVVYTDNTSGSYNALSAAAALGIKRVCLASSINAIGGAFSRWPRYDYFPLDENHPTYAEDPYSLSKWVLEQQADAFARRYEWLTVASLRFHWLIDSRERAVNLSSAIGPAGVRQLWAYTVLKEASRACLLSVTADFTGHEVFYIVAPQTAVVETSSELAKKHYPETGIRGDLSDHKGFFNCDKAERILGWQHEA